MTSQKKTEKLQLKREKKAAKLEIKKRKSHEAAPETESKRASRAVRYAEFVRGGIYVLSGVSLIVALVLGQRGAMVSLDDVVDSLFAAVAGKVILGLIALALLLYGLKNLRLIR